MCVMRRRCVGRMLFFKEGISPPFLDFLNGLLSDGRSPIIYLYKVDHTVRRFFGKMGEKFPPSKKSIRPTDGLRITQIQR